MRTLFSIFRFVWLLLSALAIAYVQIPFLRVYIPNQLRRPLEALPYAQQVLAWPEQIMWPLIFVAAIMLTDLLVIIGAFRRPPALKKVLAMPVSERRAKILVRLREYRAAAATYAELNQTGKGAKLLLSRGYRLEAATMWLVKDNLKNAVKILDATEARDAASVASLLDKHGQLEAAQRFYKIAGDYHAEHAEAGRAGRCYFKAGEHVLARPFLEQSWEEVFRPDAPREIADMLFAVEAWHAAGLAYSRAAMSLDEPEEQRSMVRRAASLLAKGGDPACGAELLEKSSQLEQAAELYAHAGNIDKSVTLLASIKHFSRAAEILSKVGLFDRAIDQLVDGGQIDKAAELAVKIGSVRKAASLLERVGKVGAALRLLEEAGEYVEAADIVRNSGDELRAASLYERGESYERAAGLYEKVGEKQRAAVLYARSNKPVKAAQLYLEAGRVREASEILGGIVTDESRILHAEIGAQLTEMGSSSMALEHLMAAVAGQPLSANNYVVYYRLAILYEQMGQDQAALQLYQQIYAIYPQLQGLIGRIQNMQQQATLLKQSAAAAQASGSKPSFAATQQGSATQASADSRYSETMAGQDAAAVASPAMVNAQTGQSVNQGDADQRYRIESVIGQGAMGQVLKAFDKVLQRGVALKVMPETLLDNDRARSAFIAEARAAAALVHPHIVTIFDVGESAKGPYIAMELIEGYDLQAYMARHPTLTLPERLRLLAQVSLALDAAHQRGIVHRDVKPGNILVDNKAQVRLVDFGIARANDSREQGDETPVGTPFYMSPEQVRGAPPDPRSDLYSLGVVIFQMTTGRLPFQEGDVLQHHLNTTAPRLLQFAPQAPEALDRLVSSCLAKNLVQRPESGAVLAQKIMDIINTMSAGAQS